MADSSAAFDLCGHMGYSEMPAEAMEFLSWRRAAVALLRPHDFADDLVSAVGAFFIDNFLRVDAGPFGSSHCGSQLVG